MGLFRPNGKSRQWLYIISASVLLLFILIWFKIIAPELKKLPAAFKYKAETLSLDNFYDETAKKFQGPQISKTTFDYRIYDKKPDYDVIENKFVVRTIDDKHIISIKRFYFINPYTWEHVPVAGQKNRIGYLFGPRYAGKKDFQYWHINYDDLGQLKFIGKEKIDGLTINHYEAHYSADQTANLGYLPGVPEKRGIKTNIKLELWIEPISGWLVNYRDNTLAYYYDRKTGLEIAPWNKFTNHYTLNSVHQEILKAKFLKWKILSIDFFIPITLLLIALMLLFLGLTKMSIDFSKLKHFHGFYYKHKKPIFRYLILFLSLLIVLESVYFFFFFQKKPIIYKIGISLWNNNADLIATVNGFKAGLAEYGFKEGENVNFIIRNPNSDIEKQIDIIQSFVDDNVNIIFTVTTPGTLVAKGITRQIPIIFAAVSYPEESAVLSPSQNNLVGIRNYIPPASQFNAFEKIYPGTKAVGFIHYKGDPDSNFQYREYKKLLSVRSIEVIDIPAIDLEDLNRQLQRKDLHYNALFLACDNLNQEGASKLVAEFSQKNKLPYFSCNKDAVQKGALMGNIADPYEVGMLAGKKAALILRGAEPRWLHTEIPQRGYLIFNLITAAILGIKIPPDALNQADQLIGRKPK